MQITSFAKVNLFLKVINKRPDGYHEIFSLMSLIDMHDLITLDVSGQLNFDKLSIEAICENKFVPKDENNLAVKAAKLFFENLNKKVNLKIKIDKKIPIGAGLGGGSSNAASVLLGLNKYYNFVFSHEKLIDIGLKIGADVPFFIFGSPAIASGIGEKLEKYQEAKSLETLNLVIVYPNFSISTKEIYKNFNFELTKSNKKTNKFFFDKKTKFHVKYMYNDLEKSVKILNYHEIDLIKQKLIYLEANNAIMSGSGSCVFGVFTNYKKAQKAFCFLNQEYKNNVYLTKLITGASPSGTAQDFGSCTRRFESSRPSQS